MTRDLLLLSLGSTTFGVWEEDITSVSPARPLHRLPLSPPVMAGMAVIDDRGVTVFDLGACLGAAPLSSTEHTRFLLLKRGEQTFGLAVAGTIETVPCMDDQVVTLPGAVRTPLVDHGMVRGDEIVPIIEVLSLLDRLEQGVLSVPVPDGPVMKNASQQEERDRLRVLSLSNERFCIEGEGTSWASLDGLRIATLPYLLGPVRGITYHDGSVISILASVGPIGGTDRRTGGSLLVLDRDGERYGILTDEDLGEASASELQPLPPLARTGWSEKAVVQHGNIILLLELMKLLAPPAKEEPRPETSASYTPASDFSARFQQGSIEVIEFSLLGALHALPREEVKEVFPPVPYRPVPGLPEIVLGVAERGKKLLPVLDLAAIFGRRTAVGGKSRMLRVVNGDFHALVLVEEVGDDRILEREVQRQVPIALPHQVLYGCYLDDRAVRLIMNVHSLAVHFERTEIRDLVASLAPVAPEPPAVEKKEERTAARVGETEAPEGTPVSADAAPAGEPAVPEKTPVSSATVPAKGSDAYGRRPFDPSSASQLRSAREEQQRREAAEAAAREEAQRKEEAARREDETRRQLEQEREREAEAARRREEEAARTKAEEEAAAARAAAERKAVEERARAADAARAESEAKERAEAEERERHARERAAAEERDRQAQEQERIRLEQQRQAAEQAARDEAKKREEEAARAETERRSEELQQREEAERRAAAARRAEELQQREQEERLRQAAARERRDEVPAAGMSEGPGMDALSDRPVRSRKALSIAAAIAAVLVLLLYWMGSPSKQEQPVRDQAQAPTSSAPAAEKEPEPPLVLDVPKAMPAPEMIVYVVVKGDTLWGISKRFTGNPFNYPRVAKDNSIATPDLIFPGQRIRLRHELQEQAEGKAKSP